jgi:hypothetical protein
MLYHLSIHLNPLYLSAVVSVATIIFIISLVKEKRHERKRA